MGSREPASFRPEAAVGPAEERLLRAFAARARALLGDAVERIVLFGSRARGDADADSDVDVAVIVRAPRGDEARLRRALREIASDSELAEAEAMPLSLLVLSAAAFEDLARRQRRIARDIEHEGIAL